MALSALVKYGRIFRKTEKVARICWNDNNWQKPSGSFNKSQNKNSFENIYGYGHEEWLFDIEKTIDGFHYSYIQGIIDKYSDETIDVLKLFATDGSRWYLIANIKNVEVISKEENDIVLEKYKQNGWFDEMKNQMKDVNINPKSLGMSNLNGEKLFNIKFKSEDIIYIDKEIEKPVAVYYKLYDLSVVNIIFKDKDIQSIINNHKTDSIEVLKKEGYVKTPKEARIHNDLFSFLVAEFYNDKNYEIKQESRQECKGRADIEIVNIKNKNRLIFEIKQGETARSCIRRAIGQLLEYGYYGDSSKPAALIAVSDQPLLDNDSKYLDRLKSEFGINIIYFCMNRVKEKYILKDDSIKIIKSLL